jgi:myogenesis-regulating glycosidase
LIFFLFIGETAWLPKEFSLKKSDSWIDEFSKNYVKLAADQNNFIEVRVGHRAQNFGIFFRILDRASDWTIHDGLKSVITATLHFGLLGYTFVLPDMIGGNDGADKSQKELFIRWTQLNAFLPAMQFGIPPWYFDEETNQICKAYVDFRESVVYPYLFNLSKPLDGQPLIRPMWWLEPFVNETYKISDQFMVGNDLVIAPILDPGVNVRNVYLPRGLWIDITKKREYVGPQTIKNYKVDIRTIGVFTSESFYQKYKPKIF